MPTDRPPVPHPARPPTLLRILAMLIGLRALTNVFKPLGAGSGLVVFGALLSGAANTVAAPLLGGYMLLLAIGMWGQRRYALPMAVAYAAFVVANVALFPLVTGLPPGTTPLTYALFALGAVSTTSGAAWLLWRDRSRLR